jgi:hypothetical protein
MPTLPLEPVYQVFLGNTWVDITDEVRTKGNTVIKRGQNAEADQPQPGSCKFTLDNSTDKYNPRNPLSPYYGLLTRNAPFRLFFGTVGDSWFSDKGTVGSYAPYLMSVAMPTGDQDMRVDFTRQNVTQNVPLLVGSSAAGGTRLLLVNGKPSVHWRASGVDHDVTASTVLPAGRVRLRATLDIDNGASGHTVSFYTAPSMSGPWTLLETSQVIAGVTTVAASPVFNGSAQWVVGDGRTHASEVRNGIGGSTVISPDFSAQTPGPSVQFTDSSNVTWEAQIDAAQWNHQTPTQPRFFGYISEWQPMENESGGDKYVPIEANGVLRRLAQTKDTPRSSLRYWVENDGLTTNYWPMESTPSGNEILASEGGLNGVATLTRPPDSWQKGDLGVDWLPNGVALYAGDSLVLPVEMGSQSFTSGSGWSLNFTFAGKDNQTLLFEVDCYTWYFALLIETTSSVAPEFSRLAYSVNGGAFTGIGITPFRNGIAQLFDMVLTANGTVIDGNTTVRNLLTGSLEGAGAGPGEGASIPLNGVRRIQVTCQSTSDQPISLSNLFLRKGRVQVYASSDAGQGRPGETFANRFRRMGDELDVTTSAFSGNLTAGRQSLDSPLDQMFEAAKSTAQVMRESRVTGGLLLRPLEDQWMRNRTQSSIGVTIPTLPVEHVEAPLLMVEDDRFLKNDITAKLTDGGQLRVSKDTGPLSTRSPELGGVGRYNKSVEYNLKNTAFLGARTTYELSKGTLDVPRFPEVKVQLLSPEVSDPEYAALLLWDVGQVFRLTGLSGLGIYEELLLQVVGYEERIGPYTHDITFQCVSNELNVVFQMASGSNYGRLDAEGSTLSAGVSSSATSLSVASTGTLWSTSSAPFDIRVAGERMTVTAISGTSSPQTFTVTRSVNGVVKAQSAGASVVLADPTYISLA